MKAWLIREESGPAGLALEEIECPAPRAREIGVEVEATALNRADLLQTMGRYPIRTEGPAVPGIEFSGRVVALGPEASAFALGDAVCGLADGGAFAEELVVDERLCMPVPAGLEVAEAGAFAETHLTAFDALRLQGRLSAGDRVLIHAAASGVGTAGIVIARELGASVAATSSPGKHETLRELGADLILDSRGDGIAEAVRDWSEGRGVDVILDMLGAATLKTNLHCAASCARWILIGLLGGTRGEIDLGRLLAKRIELRGSLLRPRSAEEKGQLITAFRTEMRDALAAGRLRPLLHATQAFDELPAAFAAMQANENVGKIAVVRKKGPR